MRNLINQKYIAVLAISILIFSAGCTKTKDKTTNATALVGLHIHTGIDTSFVDPSALNTYYADHNGRVEKLTYAQFYVTNVSFHSTTSGNWYTIPNSLFLKREENEEYALTSIPADSYDDVRFTFGLGSALNTTTPASHNSTTGADSVLSSAENFMYFGTGNGYKFMTLAGLVDTSATHNGNNPIAFTYNIGGTGDTLNVTMPVSAFSLAANSTSVQYIHIICDYGKLIQGVSITSPSVASTYGTTPQQSLATTIWNNIVNIFRYECTTPNGDC